MKKMVNHKILILHGWNALPEDHWFSAAKEKWEKKGFRVEVPNLPGNYFPKIDEWLKVIESFQPDKSWILIGHSLGGVAILKYLEIAEKPIAQAILIATPLTAMHFGSIDNFFEGGFKWENIKANCPKFEILNEDNDPAIPIEHGQKYANNLSGNLHVVPGYTHFHTINLKFLEKLIESKN